MVFGENTVELTLESFLPLVNFKIHYMKANAMLLISDILNLIRGILSNILCLSGLYSSIPQDIV